MDRGSHGPGRRMAKLTTAEIKISQGGGRPGAVPLLPTDQRGKGTQVNWQRLKSIKNAPRAVNEPGVKRCSNPPRSCKSKSKAGARGCHGGLNVRVESSKHKLMAKPEGEEKRNQLSRETQGSAQRGKHSLKRKCGTSAVTSCR